ncbi:MAG: VOC family protein [Janthinobacterium lividum]
MTADHCGFQVRSLEAAIRFYTEKLGFTLDTQSVNEAEQEAYAFLSLGTARLELIQDLVHEYVRPPFASRFARTTAWKWRTWTRPWPRCGSNRFRLSKVPCALSTKKRGSILPTRTITSWNTSSVNKK